MALVERSGARRSRWPPRAAAALGLRGRLGGSSTARRGRLVDLGGGRRRLGCVIAAADDSTVAAGAVSDYRRRLGQRASRSGTGRSGSFSSARATTASSAAGVPGGPASLSGRRRVLEVRIELRHLLAAVGERRVAGDRLEQHASERVLVGAGVEPAALDLLRGDVVDRADEGARGGDAGVRGDPLGEAEVGQVGVLAAWALLDQDVARLDVAVEKPPRRARRPARRRPGRRSRRPGRTRERRPRGSSRPDRSPSIRSIVTNSSPSSSPAWRTWTTFGWRIDTAARGLADEALAERARRSRAPGR